MSIASIYKENYQTLPSPNAEFAVSKVSTVIYVGIDRSRNICVLLTSCDPRKNAVSQRTHQVSVECNAHIKIEVAGEEQNIIVHVIRCHATTDVEKNIFLELCDTYFCRKDTKCTLDYVLEVFQTLASFFSTKQEITDIELQGLYAELYTIKHLTPRVSLCKYWQSKDKLTFDFSLTSKFKLEVKSTLRDERKHHFKHEQLITEVYDILILSYKLRFDDEGLSLLELISECKLIMAYDPEKVLKLCSILKNVPKDRLQNMKFSEEYTTANMRYFDSRMIPKFDEQTPDGVSNAEYDCLLDNISPIPEDEAIRRMILNSSSCNPE